MAEVIASKSGFSHLSKADDDKEESFVPRRTGACMLAIAASALLISGSYDSIIAKLMNKQKLPPCDGCEPQYFEAAFYQAWAMYIGEMLCLFAYYIDICVAKKFSKQRVLEMVANSKSFHKPHCPRYLWAIPAFFDLVSTVMVNYAFILSQASTVQLLRNFNVVVTAALSLIYIRVALRYHQIFGVAIVTIGLVLTGIYALLNPDQGTNYSNAAWAGILMAVVGTIVSAFQFVFEESLFRKYRASPFEAVGLMGVFGFIMSSVFLILLQVLPINGVEKTKVTFYMMSLGTSESTILIVATVTYVVSISIFNASGLTITKFGSGLLRTIMISARTFTIWLIELIIGWSSFAALNFIGLIVICIGVLIYNYNYMCSKDWFSGDAFLRKPVICCSLLRDPDALDSDESTGGDNDVSADASSGKGEEARNTKGHHKAIDEKQSSQESRPTVADGVELSSGETAARSAAP